MAEKTVRAVRIIDTSEIFMNELQDKKEVYKIKSSDKLSCLYNMHSVIPL
jgi:hypothetical protein